MNNTDNTDGRKVDWDKPIEAVHEDGRVEAVTPTTLTIQPGMTYAGRVGISRFSFAADGYPLSALCPWRIRNVATPQEAEPIKWGEPIKVDGVKPDWLDDDCYVDIQSLDSDRWYSEGASGLGVGCHHIGWYRARFIRLPHDHPHYAAQQATPAVPQEVVDRMVAHFRRVVEKFAGRDDSKIEDLAEARAIVAMLEPVDEALVACREICALDALERYKDDADNLGANLAGHYRDGDYDDDKEMSIALAAYRRALAKEAGE